MTRDDATFKEMVLRLQAGDLTRAQAAEQYGLKYNTLCQWLKRSNLASSIPMAPVEHQFKKTDPEIERATQAAVELVLNGLSSALAAARPGVTLSHREISRRVRMRRLALGRPVKRHTSRYAEK
jgi:hypothetical protein